MCEYPSPPLPSLTLRNWTTCAFHYTLAHAAGQLYIFAGEVCTAEARDADESCVQQPIRRCVAHLCCVQMTLQPEASHADRTSLLAGSRGGLRVLEWTGSLVPQGALVKGARRFAYT